MSISNLTYTEALAELEKMIEHLSLIHLSDLQKDRNPLMNFNLKRRD